MMIRNVAVALLVGAVFSLTNLLADQQNNTQQESNQKENQQQASANKSKQPVWVPTHWGWRGEWVKIPGAWKYPENEKETAWEDSRFVKKGNERLWVPGHWKEDEEKKGNAK